MLSRKVMLARLLERIPAEEIENILEDTVRKLLRNKKLQTLLVEKRYVVALDGTQKFTQTIPFAAEALHRKSGEDMVNYSVYILEATLVGPQGTIIPLLAEFCENQGEEGSQEKQDCELKGFRRLASRLKELMGKLPLLIVVDDLYPRSMEFARPRMQLLAGSRVHSPGSRITSGEATGSSFPVRARRWRPRRNDLLKRTLQLIPCSFALITSCA